MGKRLIIKGASFSVNAIDRITPSTTYYSVIYNLSHCTSSNSTTSVAEGSSYTITLTPNSGYIISSASVTHNGVEVAPTSGYTYTIPSVSGNIVIECVAIAQPSNTYSITYNLNNVTSSNNALVVNEGDTYSFTLSPDSGYEIEAVTVTHNGVVVNPTSGYTYNIANVSGNIVVTATSVHQITYHSTDVSWTKGSYINVLTNVPKSNSTYAYTDYINVEGYNTLMSKNHPAHAVAFYDENKNYVSGWVDSEVSSPVYAEDYHTTTIPSGISYIRCNSVQASNVSPLTNWSITLKDE